MNNFNINVDNLSTEENQQLKKTWNSIQYDINRKSSNANFRSTISVP